MEGLYGAPCCLARLQLDMTGQQCHQNSIFSGEFLHHFPVIVHLYFWSFANWTMTRIVAITVINQKSNLNKLKYYLRSYISKNE